MELVIETGVAMPTSSRNGGKGVAYVNTFSSMIKPVLAQMETVGQSFLYPTANIKKDRRDLLWMCNKYGAETGNRYVISEEPTGIRFFLAATGLPATKASLTERQIKVVGDSLSVIVPEQPEA